MVIVSKDKVIKRYQGKETTRHQILNHTKLAIGITTALIGGYAGRVHAGTCTSPSPSVCSGAANSGTDTTQSPAQSGGALTVTTNAGFGIDTTTKGGVAISLVNATGSISFIDANSSAITSDNSSALTAVGFSGSASITTSGVITSNGGVGISAVLSNDSSPLTINSSGNITGSLAGVFAATANTAGPILITTATGSTVEGTTLAAINASSFSKAITINANSDIVSTNGNGIFAYLEKPDASTGINITSSGPITTAGDGIYAYIYTANASDITITSNSVIESTSNDGISASIHEGKGNINVTTTAAIQSHYSGIYTYLTNNGNTLITVGGNITSTQDDGINAYQNTGGAGSVTITGNGNITGGAAKGNDGIDVYAGGAVDVNVNGVITGDPGINITSLNGPISVTGTGNVTAKGGNGIFAAITGKGATDDITIARDGIINAVGAGDGIYVRNIGKGDNIITVTKAITPDTGRGIVSYNFLLGQNADTFITLNAGADVQGGILNNAGDSTTIVNSGAALSGPITLNAGSDSLTFAGGSFTGVTTFDGGDDTDELVFNGSSGTIDAAIVTNWERIIIDSGSSIDFSDGATKSLNTGVLDNVGGTLNMVNAAPTDQLTVSGDYGGGGTLAIEAELNAGGLSDTLIVNGDTVGNTTVTVSNVGGTGAPTVGNGLLVVQVDGNSNGTFTLAGPVRSGDFLYELVKVGKNWYLQSHFSLAPTDIPTLSQWGQILLVSLLGLFGLFGSKRRKITRRIL